MNTWQKFSIRKFLNSNSRSYNGTVIALLLILLLIAVMISISVGSSTIPLQQIISAMGKKDLTSKTYQIIRFVRIPRTLAAILAGSSLSVSGAILQSVLNNSLASPNIIGVNSGAGFLTVLIGAFFPASLFLTPLAAFIGGLLAVFLVFFIAQKSGASRMSIVLSGVAVSSFIGAMTDTVLTLKPETAIDRSIFLIGGFSGVTMDRLALPAAFIIISLIVVIGLSYDMNILTLGDETAKSLGLGVARLRYLFLGLGALLSGSAISFAGLLGFVGLIVPHASRFLVGYDNSLLIPVCALLGSVFTLGCDILARILFAPFEIPVGIIMSFLGGPFFIHLLLKGKKGKLYD